MTYKLTFLESAKKEWDRLPNAAKQQFKKKLEKVLQHPEIPKAKLSGINAYKIKLRSLGYRLVYRIFEDRLVVQVICTGKRDKNLVYNLAHKKLKTSEESNRFRNPRSDFGDEVL